MDIYEVVTKLVGPIEPVGDSSRDEGRLENLKEMATLIDLLVADVYRVSKNISHYENSRILAGEEAERCLKSILDYIPEN